MTMRNHVIDNSAVLAKQIEDRKIYQAAKKQAEAKKRATLTTPYSPGAIQTRESAILAGIIKVK